MENLLEEEFYIRPLLTPEGHLALGYLLGAWLAFRDAHDLDESFTEGDQTSRNLFDALLKYESLLLPKKNLNGDS